MNRAIALLATVASLLLSTATGTRAQSVAVSVDDRSLPVTTIVSGDRVLVPMRPIFEALHANVAFATHPERVIARGAGHVVSLPIGSDLAAVDGHVIRLEVPARIVAARTFVPLRFIAQALGANVAYDAGARVVNIFSSTHARVPHNVYGVNAYGVNVSALSPEADAHLAGGYPTISAHVDSMARKADVRLHVDTTDVTPLTTFDGTTITFVPREALMPGLHSVTFDGHTLSGRAFSREWSFTTALAPPPGYDSWNGSYLFYANSPGVFYPGQWMHFTLFAPPGGSAFLQLCNLGFNYPFWPSVDAMQYQANVLVPPGFSAPNCWVNAVYHSWNGSEFIIPIVSPIAIYPMQTPAPIVTPPPRGSEPGHRRTEPTPPARRPEATPVPKATALPPKHIPKPDFTPMPPVRRLPPEPIPRVTAPPS